MSFLDPLRYTARVARAAFTIMSKILVRILPFAMIGTIVPGFIFGTPFAASFALGINLTLITSAAISLATLAAMALISRANPYLKYESLVRSEDVEIKNSSILQRIVNPFKIFLKHLGVFATFPPDTPICTIRAYLEHPKFAAATLFEKFLIVNHPESNKEIMQDVVKAMSSPKIIPEPEVISQSDNNMMHPGATTVPPPLFLSTVRPREISSSEAKDDDTSLSNPSDNPLLSDRPSSSSSAPTPRYGR